MKNRVHPRYGRDSRTDHTIERYSRCAVSYLRSAPVNHLDQYLTSFAVLSGCCSGSTEAVSTLHALVFGFLCSLLFANARTGGDINNFLSEIIESSFSSLCGPKRAAWYFFNLLLSGTAMQAMSGKNRLRTMHNPKKDQSSVRLVGASSPQNASSCEIRLQGALGKFCGPSNRLSR